MGVAQWLAPPIPPPIFYSGSATDGTNRSYVCFHCCHFEFSLCPWLTFSGRHADLPLDDNPQQTLSDQSDPSLSVDTTNPCETFVPAPHGSLTLLLINTKPLAEIRHALHEYNIAISLVLDGTQQIAFIFNERYTTFQTLILCKSNIYRMLAALRCLGSPLCACATPSSHGRLMT